MTGSRAETVNSPDATPGKTPTVLIVDDTLANVGVLADCLSSHGFSVMVAQDGEEGVERAQFGQPDLILLDVMMPGMDGFEACRRLKADGRTQDIPVVFMTALSDTADKVIGFEVGGVDYVTKPFQVEEVLARINTHLALRAMRQQLAEQNRQLQQEIAVRQQAEAALQRALDELDQRAAAEHHAREAADAANQAKSVFLASMSHELRSPLNTILGFTRLMTRQAGLPEATRDDLKLILKSGEHLHALINDVLDLSKLEAGRTTLNESDFDLAFLLDELKEMLTPAADDKGVQLIFARHPQLPRYVRGDALKLRQVLINLITNSLKFTCQGSVTLAAKPLGASEGHGDACRLAFVVADSGSGIAPDELKSLFGAFVQAQAGRKALEGTGLGLAISDGFVRLMGGEMQIESEVGEGTTVRFEIAVHPVASEPSVAPPRRVVGLPPGEPRYRILVVDDRAEGRQLLLRLLAPLGFELREAGDGLAAVELCRNWRPQLVWMDLRMPGIDGCEATRRIRALGQRPRPIIIALTASSFEEDRAGVQAADCDDLLRKPFRESELFALVEKYLGFRFVCLEELPAPGAFDPAALHALPQDVLAEFEQALVHLDTRAIERSIARIREFDAGLADGLTPLIQDFEYDRILTIMRVSSGDG
jgi:CheY-like chemotaxis protein